MQIIDEVEPVRRVQYLAAQSLPRQYDTAIAICTAVMRRVDHIQAGAGGHDSVPEAEWDVRLIKANLGTSKAVKWYVMVYVFVKP
jgi:anthranilate/para-aminobenzoate synthase component I